MSDQIALSLVAFGAINCGLIGFFEFDFIAAIGAVTAAIVARLIYALIGLAGLWSLTFFTRIEQHDPTRIS